MTQHQRKQVPAGKQAASSPSCLSSIGICFLLIVVSAVFIRSVPALGLLSLLAAGVWITLAALSYSPRPERHPQTGLRPLYPFEAGAGAHSTILYAESEYDARLQYAREFTGMMEVVWVRPLPIDSQ